MQVNRYVYADALGRRRFADEVVAGLARLGVRAVFGMPAESLNPLLDALRRDGRISLVAVRHEGAASLMAAAYGKLTGTPGVCVGTAGPGATHLLPGAYDALADRAPLLALSGQVPAEQVGLDSFQEIDSVRLFDGCSVYNRHVASPRQLGMVARALGEAAVRRGPVHLACSSDVLAAPAPVPALWRGGPPGAGLQHDKGLPAAAADRLAQGAHALLVGRTTAETGAEIDELGVRLGAPVFVLPEGHRYFARTDTAGAVPVRDRVGDEVRELLARAPGVLLVGAHTAAVRSMLTQHHVVQVADAAEAAHDRPAGWLRLLGDERKLLRDLAAAVPGPAAAHASEPARAAHALPRPGDPAPLWRALDGTAAPDAVLALEPGAVLDAAFTQLPVRQRDFLSSYALRCRGWALPAALGAAVALPGRPAVAVATDAGLADFAAELLTARRYDLPVTVVCVERGAPFDARGVGAAAGLAARRVTDPARLDGELRAALGTPGPSLLCVPASAAGVEREGRERVEVHGTGAAARDGSAGLLLARALAGVGVTDAYARADTAAGPLIACLRAAGITAHDIVHPESAALTGSAVAKDSGRPAVCVAAGEADLLLQTNGIYDAAYDHAPLIVLGVGRSEGVVDGTALFRDAARTARLDGTPESLAEAVRTVHRAVAGHGAAYVEICPNALEQHAGSPDLPLWEDLPSATLPPSGLLDRAAAALAAARRPLLLAGRGARGCTAELLDLASGLDAPLVTTMPGRGAVPEDHPRFAGGVGSSGHTSAAKALKGCDVLLALGVSQRGTSAFDLHGGFRLIQVDRDLARLAASPRADLRLHGTTAETLKELTRRVGALGPADAELADGRAAFVLENRQAFLAARRRAVPLPTGRHGGIRPSTVALTLADELVDGTTTVVADVGLNTLWLYRYLLGARQFVWTGSFATMGFALPAAIGIARQRPGTRILAGVGDGGLAITLSELASLAALDEPVVVCVFNNSRLGAIKFEQEIMGWPEYGSALHNGDLAALARSFGVRATTVRTRAQLRRALRGLAATRTPHLLDIVCDANEIPAPAQHRPAAAQVFAYALALGREAWRAATGGGRG
ncbi:thiamine pyrophosphate-binding protein [Streptomyces sp. AV19]|uniref:thiamine pyrophosphate-binding protein n=1 Tax=Streptomyces sp. AV19 TaxID=2793068 RepID=UPI0018FE9BFC|nr:thiamine pyrophosphate-dependent enzyme [Streptomyces sp. AV19]MBH1937757.1 thiamine pyrophosphate-binding protein [Streptomyces sp. AV19]MDG4536426.1 thiamine pyrophosphate-binding protein [Streptomyces sp. AV19]